jgi:integrase
LIFFKYLQIKAFCRRSGTKARYKLPVRMPQLERDPKSGNWCARKVIPADVRHVFGKREDKPVWPATLSEAEATQEYCSWLSHIEAKIAAARSGKVALSNDQIRALAGRWYKEHLSAEEKRGEPASTHNAILAALHEPKSPTIAELVAKAANALLQEEALEVDTATRKKLEAEILDLHKAIHKLLLKHAKGDYAATDEMSKTLPKWQPPSHSPADKKRDNRLRLSGLFKKWSEHPEQQKGNAAATIARYGAVFAALKAFLKDPHVAEISEEDMRRYFEFRMSDTCPATLNPRTARDVHKAALNSVFEWAKGKSLVAANPVAGYRIKYRKAVRSRSSGFRDDEAKAILDAALVVTPSNRNPTLSAALRWVPFLCAYSGARVTEITQLRAEDLQDHGTFWMLRITPEAGTVKDREERFVPLHPRLVDLGFIGFVRSAKTGPLFYDANAKRKENARIALAARRAGDVGKWVRQTVRIADERLAPNHAWRHRFKTVARQAGIDEQYVETISGHEAGTVGRRYGEHRPETLFREIEKLSVELVEGRTA